MAPSPLLSVALRKLARAKWKHKPAHLSSAEAIELLRFYEEHSNYAVLPPSAGAPEWGSE